MRATFIAQPDKNDPTIGDAVGDALMWPDATKAWFAIAWAKRSGLMLLAPAIEHLRNRRKSVRALIGIDQHGGTEEALRLAVELFSDARVYHDRARFRTFHPKLYVVETPRRARVVLGSGNLTEGGLSTNYETASQLDLDLTDAQDEAFLRDVSCWFELRWSNPDASRKLSNSTIVKLMADPTVVVVPEAAVPPPSTAGSRATADQDSTFGPAVRGLRGRGLRTGTKGLPASDVSDLTTPAVTRRAHSTRTGSSSPGSEQTRLALEHLVLAAGLPRDRPGLAGFNARVAEEFFGVSENGEEVLAEGISKGGTPHGMQTRRLVFPSGSNKNHRMELRDPDGRTRKPGEWPIILVEKLGSRRFRYVYLYEGQPGYAAMRRKIATGDGVGAWGRPETKRVYLMLLDVVQVWPSCPF